MQEDNLQKSTQKDEGMQKSIFIQKISNEESKHLQQKQWSTSQKKSKKQSLHPIQERKQKREERIFIIVKIISFLIIGSLLVQIGIKRQRINFYGQMLDSTFSDIFRQQKIFIFYQFSYAYTIKKQDCLRRSRRISNEQPLQIKIGKTYKWENDVLGGSTFIHFYKSYSTLFKKTFQKYLNDQNKIQIVTLQLILLPIVRYIQSILKFHASSADEQEYYGITTFDATFTCDTNPIRNKIDKSKTFFKDSLNINISLARLIPQTQNQSTLFFANQNLFNSKFQKQLQKYQKQQYRSTLSAFEPKTSS